MVSYTCRKCKRMVDWGARTCRHCGCESPTSENVREPKKFVRKKRPGGSVPSLMGNWWWIVLCLLFMAAVIFSHLFGLYDFDRFFPKVDWK